MSSALAVILAAELDVVVACVASAAAGWVDKVAHISPRFPQISVHIMAGLWFGCKDFFVELLWSQ